MLIREAMGGVMALGLMAGLVANGSVLAADYSVAIYHGKVTGLDLYTITATGVSLAPGSPYVLQQTDPSGNPYYPEPFTPPTLLFTTTNATFVQGSLCND